MPAIFHSIEPSHFHDPLYGIPMRLQREGYLPEAMAKLYAAEVLLALEHLHERNVVYRDLKPEMLGRAKYDVYVL